MRKSAARCDGCCHHRPRAGGIDLLRAINADTAPAARRCCRAPTKPMSSESRKGSRAWTDAAVARRPGVAHAAHASRPGAFAARHRAQRSLRGAGGAGGLRLRRRQNRQLARDPVRPGMSASSATTTPSNGSGSPCRSRNRRCVRTSCAPRCASTNTRVAGWRCSGGRTGSPNMMPKADRSFAMRWPPEPLRPPDRLWTCGYRFRDPHNTTAATTTEAVNLTCLQKPVNLTCYLQRLFTDSSGSSASERVTS